MTDVRLKEIKLIGFDVDGTLTDGTISVDDHGLERKSFHIGDGLGIRLALTAGLKIYLVSGRKSEATKHRFVMVPPENLLMGTDDKAAVLEEIFARERIHPLHTAFMGDDLNDLPAFGVAGFRVAPANAVDAIKSQADLITSASGGFGAAREFIDRVLMAQGIHDETVKTYFEALADPAKSIII